MRDVLNPITGDQRDSSIDRTPRCPRCDTPASEAHVLPCGCVVAACEACCAAPRYFGWLVPAKGCRQAVVS